MSIIKAFGGKTVTRAPKGGFEHPVNGKQYRGGQFCPMYAVAGGSDEASNVQAEIVAMLADPAVVDYGVVANCHMGVIYNDDNATGYAGMIARGNTSSFVAERAEKYAREARRYYRILKAVATPAELADFHAQSAHRIARVS